MPGTIATAASSTPRNSLDSVRPRTAKASLPVNRSHFLTELVRDGLLAACGSLKAAAITMGIDQGQLTRDLQSGAFKFERLERLSEDEQCVVIRHLHEAFASLSDPVTQARHALDVIDGQVKELRQYIEHART